DEQVAGARVEVASYKKDPADFVLWKPSTQDQVGWDSPWGFGRPGWHIECSAMAEKHLGLPFDIHGGGADLKFPHHENEIAQSCCAHGKTDDLSEFSKYWVHNGFVTVEGEKMSKSLGNVTLAHELLEQGIDGEVIRLALLSSQYRKPLDWTATRLEESQKFLNKIKKVWNEIGGIEESPAERGSHYKEFLVALCDDLNTPEAFSKINMLLSSIKKDMKADKLEKVSIEKSDLRKSMQILGITLNIEKQSADVDTEKVNNLIESRKQAKANKDFSKSDAIREELLAMGIVIKDTREGTTWECVS
ncbi:MAG: class I tRNA ligase family protein, partial [Alphaproteobacteria bacterium]|nr:class I tRNA ligase family protein [Alphaproteobacteria bacterium]